MAGSFRALISRESQVRQNMFATGSDGYLLESPLNQILVIADLTFAIREGWHS